MGCPPVSVDSTSGRGVNHFLAQGYNPQSRGHARPLCGVELGGKLAAGRLLVVIDAELGADPISASTALRRRPCTARGSPPTTTSTGPRRRTRMTSPSAP